MGIDWRLVGDPAKPSQELASIGNMLDAFHQRKTAIEQANADRDRLYAAQAEQAQHNRALETNADEQNRITAGHYAATAEQARAAAQAAHDKEVLDDSQKASADVQKRFGENDIEGAVGVAQAAGGSLAPAQAQLRDVPQVERPGAKDLMALLGRAPVTADQGQRFETRKAQVASGDVQRADDNTAFNTGEQARVKDKYELRMPASPMAMLDAQAEQAKRSREALAATKRFDASTNTGAAMPFRKMAEADIRAKVANGEIEPKDAAKEVLKREEFYMSQQTSRINGANAARNGAAIRDDKEDGKLVFNPWTGDAVGKASTIQGAAKINDGAEAIVRLHHELNALRESYSKHGRIYDITSQPAKDRDAAMKRLDLAYKDAAKLGAITGPDEKYLVGVRGGGGAFLYSGDPTQPLNALESHVRKGWSASLRSRGVKADVWAPQAAPPASPNLDALDKGADRFLK